MIVIGVQNPLNRTKMSILCTERLVALVLGALYLVQESRLPVGLPVSVLAVWRLAYL